MFEHVLFLWQVGGKIDEGEGATVADEGASGMSECLEHDGSPDQLALHLHVPGGGRLGEAVGLGTSFLQIPWPSHGILADVGQHAYPRWVPGEAVPVGHDVEPFVTFILSMLNRMEEPLATAILTSVFVSTSPTEKEIVWVSSSTKVTGFTPPFTFGAKSRSTTISGSTVGGLKSWMVNCKLICLVPGAGWT